MMYYVATIAHYVIVQSHNVAAAQRKARPLLSALAGRHVTYDQITTTRLATDEEVELDQFHRDHQGE